MIIFHQEQKRKRSLLAEYFIKLAAILYGKVLVDACIIVRSLFLLCLPIHLVYYNSLVYKTVAAFPVFYEPNLKVTSLDGHEQKLINHYTAISYKKYNRVQLFKFRRNNLLRPIHALPSLSATQQVYRDSLTRPSLKCTIGGEFLWCTYFIDKLFKFLSSF